MFCEMRKPKYTNIMTHVQVFDTGLEKWDNIEEIFKVPVRNKVICRFDMVNLLSDYFTEESLVKYRDALYFIATGNIKDADLLSKFLKMFLDTDQKFHRGIEKIYHNCPLDKSFGEYIAIDFAMVMLKYQQELSEYLVGKSEFVILNSDGYLYISVPDVTGHKMTFPHADKFKEMYNGKNWRITV